MSQASLPHQNREERDRLLVGVGVIVLLALLLLVCCASSSILRLTTPINASGPNALLPAFADYDAWNGVAPFPLGQEAVKSKEGDRPADAANGFDPNETPISIGVIDLMPSLVPTSTDPRTAVAASATPTQDALGGQPPNEGVIITSTPTAVNASTTANPQTPLATLRPGQPSAVASSTPGTTRRAGRARRPCRPLRRPPSGRQARGPQRLCGPRPPFRQPRPRS